MNKKYLFFSFIVLINIFVFFPVFSIFFGSDDFFVLSQVQVENIKGFFELFLPHSQVVYYRPLGIQFYFWFVKFFFGLNPLAFHLITFIFHIANSILVYYIAQKLGNNEKITYLTCFLWSLSPIHYLSLAWIVNFSFIFVTFFFFLSLLFWLNKKNNLSYISFFIGMFVNEFILVLPVFLIFYELLIGKSKTKKFLKQLSPFFLIIAPYFLLRLFLPGKYEGVYVWKFDFDILNTIKWYFLWSLGWAETMKDQMKNFYYIRTSFRNSFPEKTFIYLSAFFIFIACFLILPTCLLLFKGLKTYTEFIKKEINIFLTCFILFFLALLFVIFTSDHIYPHYLTIAGFGIYFGFSYFFVKALDFTKKRILEYVFIFFWAGWWIFLSFTTVRFNAQVHWVPRNANFAKKLIYDLKEKTDSKNGKIYITSNSEDKKIALAQENALKVFLGNGWRTYFLKPKELENKLKKLYDKDYVYYTQENEFKINKLKFEKINIYFF